MAERNEPINIKSPAPKSAVDLQREREREAQDRLSAARGVEIIKGKTGTLSAFEKWKAKQNSGQASEIRKGSLEDIEVETPEEVIEEEVIEEAPQGADLETEVAPEQTPEVAPEQTPEIAPEQTSNRATESTEEQQVQEQEQQPPASNIQATTGRPRGGLTPQQIKDIAKSNGDIPLFYRSISTRRSEKTGNLMASAKILHASELNKPTELRNRSVNEFRVSEANKYPAFLLLDPTTGEVQLSRKTEDPQHPREYSRLGFAKDPAQYLSIVSGLTTKYNPKFIGQDLIKPLASAYESLEKDTISRVQKGADAKTELSKMTSAFAKMIDGVDFLSANLNTPTKLNADLIKSVKSSDRTPDKTMWRTYFFSAVLKNRRYFIDRIDNLAKTLGLNEQLGDKLLNNQPVNKVVKETVKAQTGENPKKVEEAPTPVVDENAGRVDLNGNPVEQTQPSQGEQPQQPQGEQPIIIDNTTVPGTAESLHTRHHLEQLTELSEKQLKASISPLAPQLSEADIKTINSLDTRVLTNMLARPDGVAPGFDQYINGLKKGRAEGVLDIFTKKTISQLASLNRFFASEKYFDNLDIPQIMSLLPKEQTNNLIPVYKPIVTGDARLFILVNTETNEPVLFHKAANGETRLINTNNASEASKQLSEFFDEKVVQGITSPDDTPVTQESDTLSDHLQPIGDSLIQEYAIKGTGSSPAGIKLSPNVRDGKVNGQGTPAFSLDADITEKPNGSNETITRKPVDIEDAITAQLVKTRQVNKQFNDLFDSGSVLSLMKEPQNQTEFTKLAASHNETLKEFVTLYNEATLADAELQQQQQLGEEGIQAGQSPSSKAEAIKRDVEQFYRLQANLGDAAKGFNHLEENLIARGIYNPDNPNATTESKAFTAIIKKLRASLVKRQELQNEMLLNIAKATKDDDPVPLDNLKELEEQFKKEADSAEDLLLNLDQVTANMFDKAGYSVGTAGKLLDMLTGTTRTMLLAGVRNRALDAVNGLAVNTMVITEALKHKDKELVSDIIRRLSDVGTNSREAKGLITEVQALWSQALKNGGVITPAISRSIQSVGSNIARLSDAMTLSPVKQAWLARSFKTVLSDRTDISPVVKNYILQTPELFDAVMLNPAEVFKEFSDTSVMFLANLTPEHEYEDCMKQFVKYINGTENVNFIKDINSMTKNYRNPNTLQKVLTEVENAAKNGTITPSQKAIYGVVKTLNGAFPFRSLINTMARSGFRWAFQLNKESTSGLVVRNLLDISTITEASAKRKKLEGGQKALNYMSRFLLFGIITGALMANDDGKNGLITYNYGEDPSNTGPYGIYLAGMPLRGLPPFLEMSLTMYTALSLAAIGAMTGDQTKLANAGAIFAEAAGRDTQSYGKIVGAVRGQMTGDEQNNIGTFLANDIAFLNPNNLKPGIWRDLEKTLQPVKQTEQNTDKLVVDPETGKLYKSITGYNPLFMLTGFGRGGSRGEEVTNFEEAVMTDAVTAKRKLDIGAIKNDPNYTKDLETYNRVLQEHPELAQSGANIKDKDKVKIQSDAEKKVAEVGAINKLAEAIAPNTSGEFARQLLKEYESTDPTKSEQNKMVKELIADPNKLKSLTEAFNAWYKENPNDEDAKLVQDNILKALTKYDAFKPISKSENTFDENAVKFLLSSDKTGNILFRYDKLLSDTGAQNKFDEFDYGTAKGLYGFLGEIKQDVTDDNVEKWLAHYGHISNTLMKRLKVQNPELAEKLLLLDQYVYQNGGRDLPKYYDTTSGSGSSGYKSGSGSGLYGHGANVNYNGWVTPFINAGGLDLGIRPQDYALNIFSNVVAEKGRYR